MWPTPPAKKREYNRRYYARHREELRVKAKARRQANGEKIRAYSRAYYAKHCKKLLRAARLGSIRRLYGLTEEAYTALLKRQRGRCAICGTTKPNGHGFHVDHNHKTGKVRGILCYGCNVGIGSLKDSPKILRRAIKYLARRKS